MAQHAQGEYIYFFDADDILTLDALESLYNVANEKKADLVIAKYDIFNNEKVIEKGSQKIILNTQDEIKKITKSNSENTSYLFVERRNEI